VCVCRNPDVLYQVIRNSQGRTFCEELCYFPVGVGVCLCLLSCKCQRPQLLLVSLLTSLLLTLGFSAEPSWSLCLLAVITVFLETCWSSGKVVEGGAFYNLSIKPQLLQLMHWGCVLKCFSSGVKVCPLPSPTAALLVFFPEASPPVDYAGPIYTPPL
jgi:hypothetical protein